MVILFQPLLGYAKDFMSEVARANELHANNNFQEAADAYESIHEAGLENGYLYYNCLLYTSPSPRDLSTSRMPSSA